MRQFVRHAPLWSLAFILPLASCGGGDKDANALASLDTRLTNGMVEGNVAASAQPHAGAVPTTAPAPNDGKSVVQSTAHAPAPTPMLASAGNDGNGKAGVSRLASATGRPVGGCAGRGMRYGDQWVDAMPTGLGLYPGARLIEAAGTDTGRCALRAMSFTTTDAPNAVVAHYVARVRKAGFDAERQPCRDEIRLGGTRASDDAAYMLFARRNAKGVTEVDIVASAGPTV